MGASSIAQQIGTSVDHANELLDGYYKGNPSFAKFVSDNQANLKNNHGFITLPYFNHRFYIGNPYHYSIKQKGLNYILQNLSSSLCAYLAFELYKDLRGNYDIIINYYAFIHDKFSKRMHND
jgi:hypothetical protein